MFFRGMDYWFLMNVFFLVFGVICVVFLIWDLYGLNLNYIKIEFVICIIIFGVGIVCVILVFSYLLLIVLESICILFVLSKF